MIYFHHIHTNPVYFAKLFILVLKISGFYFIFFFFFNLFFKDPEPLSIESVEKSELPKLVIVGIALAGLGLLIINAVLVAWFIIRRRNKGTFIFSFIFVISFSVYFLLA